MKILCFTTSFNRPYHLYHTINSILNQSYKDIMYSVSLNIKDKSQIPEYQDLYSDLNDPRLKININVNRDQHTNYLTAMKGFGHTDFDLFIKIDDDDIYHKNYIKNSIEHFTNPAEKIDILSYYCKHHINNNFIRGRMDNIGKWGPDGDSKIQFGMPPTYIFNKAAYNVIEKITPEQVRQIHMYEDNAWRQYWRKNNLISKVILPDHNMLTYIIHGNNTSSNKWLENEKPTIENDHCAIVWTKHPDWNSYIYINKRNNRLYNINNNDHGSYQLVKGDGKEKLIINWDGYPTETFAKFYQDKSYIYELLQ